MEPLGSKIARCLAGLPSPTRANAYNAHMAARYCGGVSRAKVLVVGCNTGRDCRYFVEMGAAEVHGLDVIQEVGGEFHHPRVSYHRMSAERINLPDGSFDLVYAFATLEHVPRIELAFPEMARVLRPSGVLYSVAAPLWNSAYGHHKGDIFRDHPWIHLRMDRAEILALYRANGVEHHVDYMLDPRFFNRKPARAYVEACEGLENVEFIRNELGYDEPENLTPELERELASLGYPRSELLATTHTVVARKRPFALPADLSRTLRTRLRGAMLERAPWREIVTLWPQ